MKALAKSITIGIVAPSYSLDVIDRRLIEIGENKLNSLGCNVKYGKHVYSRLRSSSIAGTIGERIEDIHNFLLDEDVDIIMSVIGGYGSVQLLDKLDYSLINKSKKKFIGYSDTTTMLNAIHVKTDNDVFIGPAFVSFCNPWIAQATLDCFQKIVLNGEKTYDYQCPTHFYCNEWHLNSSQRRPIVLHKGYRFINRGKVSSAIVGGNLPSFMRLIGTPYLPDFAGKILFIEGVSDERSEIFLDQLYQLRLSGILNHIVGLVVGQFGDNHPFYDVELLERVLKDLLKDLDYPIVINAPFSHVDPQYVFKLGSTVELDSDAMSIRVLN